jgi:hypothetical protein
MRDRGRTRANHALKTVVVAAVGGGANPMATEPRAARLKMLRAVADAVRQPVGSHASRVKVAATVAGLHVQDSRAAVRRSLVVAAIVGAAAIRRHGKSSREAAVKSRR